MHRIIRLILQDRRILVVRWIGARVGLGRRFLCIELTRLHDDEAQRLQRNRQLRRLVILGSHTVFHFCSSSPSGSSSRPRTTRCPAIGPRVRVTTVTRPSGAPSR